MTCTSLLNHHLLSWMLMGVWISHTAVKARGTICFLCTAWETPLRWRVSLRLNLALFYNSPLGRLNMDVRARSHTNLNFERLLFAHRCELIDLARGIGEHISRTRSPGICSLYSIFQAEPTMWPCWYPQTQAKPSMITQGHSNISRNYLCAGRRAAIHCRACAAARSTINLRLFLW